MIDPTPARTERSLTRRAVIALLLLAATFAFGAAARRAREPHSTPPRVTAGASAVVLDAGLDRGAVLQGGDGLVRVELLLRGGAVASANAPRIPTDLVVVLDRSGSMAGQPIATALAALRELIAGLADGDRFALVSYAANARIDIPLEAASRSARERWSRQIEALSADGATHTSAGLDLGHALLADAARPGAAERLIVLSDGHANLGDFSLEGLRSRAGRARVGEYVLSAVGIGTGFDETVMSALADAGTGNFYYLPDAARLGDVFAGEFAAARETVARALTVKIAPGPDVRVAAAGGYPLETAGEFVSFRPGDLFAGQERRVWLDLHAPTRALGRVPLGGVAVEFATTSGERERVEVAALPEPSCVAHEADYYASFDAERYQRANRTQGLGELKQRAAHYVASGRPAEALADVEEYRQRIETEQLRSLGYVDGGASRSLDELSAALSAPEASTVEGANQLGKDLLESGRDDQRAGAKR